MEVAFVASALQPELPFLSEPVRRLVLERAALQRFSPGERIPPGAESDRRVYYILRGRVRIVLHGRDGQHKILAILDRGTVLGDVDLVRPTRPLAACYAVEVTETYVWRRETVLALVQEHPELGLYIMASLARKVKLLTAQIQTLSFFNAAQRVMRTFAHLAQIYGEPERDGTRIALRLTQSEIGEIANASRVTVNKVFNRLKVEGLMSKRQGCFVVHDVDRLFAYAHAAAWTDG